MVLISGSCGEQSEHLRRGQDPPLDSQSAAVDPGHTRGKLYAFEGKGHLPIFTATDEFCEVLRRFVRTGTATA